MHTVPPSALTSLSPAGGSPRRSMTRRCASAVAVMVVATLGLATTPALAEDCPNAALRAQNNSTQLPDCRAYEQVSPVFKEGYAPTPRVFNDDGRLSYISNGNYDNNGNGTAAVPGGNAYLATRTGSGWSTTSPAPSEPEYVTANGFTHDLGATAAAVPVAFSRDLRSTVWNMRRGDQPVEVQDLYVRDPDGVFTQVGSAPDQPTGTDGTSMVSVSDDLSHVVYSGTSGETYEYVGIGGPRRTVSVDNAGQSLLTGPQCASTRANRVSANGRVIFFRCNGPAGANDSDVVYARVGGTTTIAVSGSQCTRAPSDLGGACNPHSGASFQGANADGTRAYFTTSQQLVNGDIDDTNDLYACDIPAGTVTPVGSVNPCPGLREVSGEADGAGVEGVTGTSGDGSRVYFVATGVLASNPDANGATALAGGKNLYVWSRDDAHPDGQTRFVATVDIDRAQLTDDGRYLVITSNTQLIDHGPQADTDTARDAYRYDAETGSLARLSIDAGGTGGNQPGADASIITAPRGSISDDGGSVVFTTADTLAPNDTNGTVDAYLWHDGRVSLISSGKPSRDDYFTIGGDQSFGSWVAIQTFISPSGRDVFFMTTEQLIPGDVDTIMDIYDAHVDGGFDQSTPPTCTGDACQGRRSVPPTETKPDSASSTGEDGAPQMTPAFSVGKLTASQLKRVASTGKVSLVVTTNAPGTLSAKATATIAKRSSTVGSARRTVAKAGTVSVTLTLSKKARAELKRQRKLTVKVLVGQDNVAIARAVSLKVIQPKTTKKRAKQGSLRTTSRQAAKGGRS
jgi:hypothetical protein